MSYVLLMMEDPEQRGTRTEAEGAALYDRMLRFGEDLKARGKLVASQSLASTKDGVRLQKRDGKRLLVDGPFAEAREMVGGFFVVDVETLDEAVEIADECPASEWLTVEVRKLGPCFA